MFNLIRNKLMAEDQTPLSGEVEIDETSVDGRPRKFQRRGPDPLRRSVGENISEAGKPASDAVPLSSRPSSAARHTDRAHRL